MSALVTLAGVTALFMYFLEYVLLKAIAYAFLVTVLVWILVFIVALIVVIVDEHNKPKWWK